MERLLEQGACIEAGAEHESPLSGEIHLRTGNARRRFAEIGTRRMRRSGRTPSTM
jgi:hypothetical protein